LGLIGGAFEYLENIIKVRRDEAGKANEDQNSFKTVLLIYSNVAESPSKSNASNMPSRSESQRFP
jgi:hypothetical protein